MLDNGQKIIADMEAEERKRVREERMIKVEVPEDAFLWLQGMIDSRFPNLKNKHAVARQMLMTCAQLNPSKNELIMGGIKLDAE